MCGIIWYVRYMKYLAYWIIYYNIRRAMGLFASGIGVGSFGYLRRIFECIIITASHKAIEEKIIKKKILIEHILIKNKDVIRVSSKIISR